MRITILGNNSALPAFGRHPSSQAVTIYGEALLLDCGEGTQLQMQRYGVKWKNVNHIFISHMHGDHYFGLPGLINSMSLLGRTAPLHLYGPAGLMPILDAILSVANTVLAYPLHFYELPAAGGVIAETDTFSVRNFPVSHGIECHGFLITTKTRGRRILPIKCAEYGIEPEDFPALKQGQNHMLPDGTIVRNEWVTEEGPSPIKYAYCADTRYTEDFIEVIQDANAIYHEATYLHNDVEKAASRYHSTAVQAAQLARMANAGKLLLGHFSSKYKDLEPFRDEAAVIFPDVMIAVEGVAYDL